MRFRELFVTFGQIVEIYKPRGNHGRLGWLANLAKISIDFAVMEPAASDGLVYTHPAEIEWSDFGTWEGLRQHLNESKLN